MLEKNFPEEAKLRKKVKEELDKETLENRNNLAKIGDICGLIPFDRLLDNRELLALAAENREKDREKDTMFIPIIRYQTFIYFEVN